MRTAIVSVLAGLAACATAGVDPDGGAGPIDARRDSHAPPPGDGPAIDAPMIDARDVDAPAGVVASLQLTEIVLAPTGGELIELVNPGSTAVDLGTYYLSDAPGYFRLPAGVAMVGADSTDFVAKFPAAR